MKNNNNNQLKSIGLGIIIISLVALIVFTPKIMENLSCVKELMNDTTNIILLCTLTLCITLIDPLMGLMFALCIGVLAVYLKQVDTNTLKEVETFMIEQQNPRTLSQSLSKSAMSLSTAVILALFKPREALASITRSFFFLCFK